MTLIHTAIPIFNPTSQTWVCYLGSKAAHSHSNPNPYPNPNPNQNNPPPPKAPPKCPGWTAPWRSLAGLPTLRFSSSGRLLPPPTRSLSPDSAPSPTTLSPAAGRSSRPVPPTPLSSASSFEWEIERLFLSFVN